MRHLLLVLGVLLYVVTWAQNWTWYAGALMLRAIASDWERRAAEPVASGADD